MRPMTPRDLLDEVIVSELVLRAGRGSTKPGAAIERLSPEKRALLAELRSADTADVRDEQAGAWVETTEWLAATVARRRFATGTLAFLLAMSSSLFAAEARADVILPGAFACRGMPPGSPCTTDFGDRGQCVYDHYGNVDCVAVQHGQQTALAPLGQTTAARGCAQTFAPLVIALLAIVFGVLGSASRPRKEAES